MAQEACAAWPAGAAVARDALAVLRPEHLALADADAAAGWPGRVTACRFAGGSTVLHVALAEGCTVQVATARRGVREGDAVRVRLDAPCVALVATEGRVGAPGDGHAAHGSVDTPPTPIDVDAARVLAAAPART